MVSKWEIKKQETAPGKVYAYRVLIFTLGYAIIILDTQEPQWGSFKFEQNKIYTGRSKSRGRARIAGSINFSKILTVMFYGKQK